MTSRLVSRCVYLALVMGCGIANVSHAGNLVQNGDFSDNQFNNVSHELASGSYHPSGITGSGVANWTNTTNNAYNIWFNKDNASTTSAVSQYSGPQQLSASYNTTNLPSSVNGFLALDGDSGVHGAITQSIGNATTGFLTVGQQYEVSFWWAATELSNRNGYTTERLDVSLGSSPVQSVAYGDPNGTNAEKLAPNAFTGWMQGSMIFTATAATETLSFLSNGTPNGEPPIILLADVSMQAVPEPSSLALTGLGIIGLFVVRARRRAKFASGQFPVG